MNRGRTIAALLGVVMALIAGDAFGQMRIQPANQTPALEETPSTAPGATPPPPPQEEARPKERLARVWANEPPLVRLARDKFGAELTETDAKFFNAVATSDWADFRPSPDATYNPQKPASWAKSPVLKADRIVWLCTDSSAVKLVPSRGIWLRGAVIDGQVDFFRCNVPFALQIYDCIFQDGFNIRYAKLNELYMRNCCSFQIYGRDVQVSEGLYLVQCACYRKVDLIDARIGGDLDFTGSFVFHGMSREDLKREGIVLSLDNAEIGGNLRLSDKFRAVGQVQLVDAKIGRDFVCSGSKFTHGGQTAIDARGVHVAGSIEFDHGFQAEGGVIVRGAHIGVDLNCTGGRFIAKDEAIDANMVNVGGMVCFCHGFHAEGHVRLVNAVVGGELNCNNGHFLNPTGTALSIDGATINKQLRLGVEPGSPTDADKKLPPGFLARGMVNMLGTQVNLDVLAVGGQIEAPGNIAILGCNMRVGSRMDMSEMKIQGLVNLSCANIEHELDLRGTQIDAKGTASNLALWANGIDIGSYLYCHLTNGPEGPLRFRVNGRTSFQFATIAMNWDLRGAQFICPGDDALDASDCRVAGYVHLDDVLIDGRASFSRAKIDGIWIINKMVEPEKMQLDMRFAHIWVIKDERLDDWPPAGQLQLEGLVYDHFDDDSPLDVNDRLAWLRRQYAPTKKSSVRRGSPDPAQSADRRSPTVPNVLNVSAAAVEDTEAHEPEIFPAQFETPSMPAPQMSPPAPMPMPMPTTVPTERQPYRSYPMMAPEEGTGAKMAAPVAVDQKAVAAPTADTTANPDSESGEKKDESAATNAKAVVSTPVPDPAGRRYVTQPYTQLASVYRAIGQDEQANAVLVARAERLGELATPFSAQGLWYRYIGRLIGYGYEPFRAIKIGAVIVVGGAVIFAVGARRNLMAETKLAEQVLMRVDDSGVVSSSYPRFNPFVYSLDVFLPFVELNQVCYWIPGERPLKGSKSRNCLMHIGRYTLKWSSVLHAYLWFQTLAGWTLCTLLAAAVTGIVES